MFFGKRFSGHSSGGLSGLEILVLSIIKNNDGISGYDISQEINKNFRGLWKASAGTIYPLLNRLTESEYVQIEEITENNRQKKIHRITEKGTEILKKVTKDNLQPSINTLGDYIRTVVKAAIPNEHFFNDIVSCFPFQENIVNEEIDENDYTLNNINKIERIIGNLERRKERLTEQINRINNEINHFHLVLEKVKEEREQKRKIIEIIDDDEES